MAEDTTETVRKMSSFVNGMDRTELKEFCDLMGCEHRTLQQSFTRLTLAWLKHLAQRKEYEFDARNEYSVKIARKLLQGVEDWELNTPLI